MTFIDSKKSAYKSPTSMGESSPRRAPRSTHFGPKAEVLNLHESLGNRAVRQVLQPKLKINQPGDKYEQEADRVAEMVMRMPDSAVSDVSHRSQMLQRKCASCASGGGACPKCAEEEELLYRKENTASAPQVTPNVAAQINSLRGGGEPLPDSTRAYFEPRFGADFSNVRIHRNAAATESAQAINAQAYTVGSNIVFGKGQYTPESSKSKQLLAHELTHVVQQTKSAERIQRSLDDPLCQEYDAQRIQEQISLVLEIIIDPSFLDSKNTMKRSLITALKEIHRCADESLKASVLQLLKEKLGEKNGDYLWQLSVKPFAGYWGMYPDYRKNYFEPYLDRLGIEDKGAIKSIGNGPRTHRRRATASFADHGHELYNPDILFFRGHHFGEYRTPGVFTSDKVNQVIDLRYLGEGYKFPGVRLIISTSCAVLCKEAIEIFSKVFPNAVILGYKQYAPYGDATWEALKSAILDLKKPLILEKDFDVNAIINVWKNVIEKRHPQRTNNYHPGYYTNGQVFYWNHKTWNQLNAAESTNQCRYQGDSRMSFPAPEPEQRDDALLKLMLESVNSTE